MTRPIFHIQWFLIPAASLLTIALHSPATAGQKTECWYLIEFDGRHVGHEHLTASGTDPIARTRETRLQIRRFGTDLSLTALLETRESADGRLLEWSLRRTAADGKSVERQGLWNGMDSAYDAAERLQATRRTFRLAALQQPRSAIISEWAPVLAEASSRRFRSAVLFPETSSIVDMEFEVSGQQSLRTPDGQALNVSRINYWPAVDPEKRTSLFVNQSGQVVRSEQPLLGSSLVMIRTDPASALGSASLESLDLELAATIPVTRPIASPGRREQTRLKIIGGIGDLIDLPSGKFQQIELAAGNEAIVTLSKPVLRENTGVIPSAPRRKLPSDPFLAASRWITMDDHHVQRLVRSAIGGSTQDAENCRRLTRYLFVHMKPSRFSTSFLPASEAARQLRGDCTEHAILLISMMRVCQIPSRAVIGFVYNERSGGFVPHMWTEALLDGIWMPFDSTVGADGMSATYLRVTDSALGDDVTSGTLLFLPLLNLMGRVRIEVLSELGF